METLDGRMLPQLRREPKYVAFVTDAAHAAQIKTQINLMLVECKQVSHILEHWQEKGGERFVIVVMPLRATKAIGIFVSDGPRSLRRQMTRAVESCRGARTMWLRGLSDHDGAIVTEVLNDTCEHAWRPGLDDLRVGSRA